MGRQTLQETSNIIYYDSSWVFKPIFGDFGFFRFVSPPGHPLQVEESLKMWYFWQYLFQKGLLEMVFGQHPSKPVKIDDGSLMDTKHCRKDPISYTMIVPGCLNRFLMILDFFDSYHPLATLYKLKTLGNLAFFDNFCVKIDRY